MEIQPAFQNIDEFRQAITRDEAALCYFSHDACNVCKVLKPKIYRLLETRFPEIQFYYINTQQTPEIAAQNSVFAVPTIIQFFQGQEFFRKSRNFGINDLQEALARPYSMLFPR